MISKWDYVGYYFGLTTLSILLLGLIFLGINNLKYIWNRKLDEHFKELLKWDKRSFFYVFGFIGIGLIKLINLIIPSNWTLNILNVIYCVISSVFLLLGTLGIYLLVTDFYFSPTIIITEIIRDFN